MDQEEKEKALDNTWNNYLYAIGKFDDQSLFISSGALGLSLTFIKDIVPIKDCIYIGLFYIAIICFLLTIVAGFINHFYSANTLRKAFDKTNNNESDTENYKEKHSKRIRNINRFLTGSLIIGLIGLVLYCVINISNYRTTMANNKLLNLQSQKSDTTKLNKNNI